MRSSIRSIGCSRGSSTRKPNHRGFLLTRGPLVPRAVLPRPAATPGPSWPTSSRSSPTIRRSRHARGAWRTLAGSRLDEMAYVLKLNDAGDPAAAVARIIEGLGKRLMDELRVLATEMRASEATLLTQRASQAELAERGALGFRRRQPPGGGRTGVRGHLGGTQLRAPSRRADGARWPRAPPRSARPSPRPLTCSRSRASTAASSTTRATASRCSSPTAGSS